MPYEFLLTRRSNQVEHATLNRPEVRNALNAGLIAELTHWAAATADAARRHEVRAAVLAGAGPAFCAGGDARWMAAAVGYTEAENLRDAETLAAMFAALDGLPVPLIARIHGAALGGGAGLAAVSDVVVADAGAVFGFTEVKLGIVASTIGPFVLAKIGRSAARELFLTGRRFSAAHAQQIGLVHAVETAADLDRRVEGYLSEISGAGPDAVAASKALIRDVWPLAPAEAAPVTAAVIARRRVSSEGQEGLRAFLEKRKPSWTPGAS
jgi:methylglutaconyl-CoA hydratase